MATSRLFGAITLILSTVIFVLLTPLPASAQEVSSTLFFSEYIEGSSYNKALEIYNPTDSDINISSYTVEIYSNGNLSPNVTIGLAPPSPLAARGGIYVICHGSASPAILNLCHQNVNLTFNGNDAVVLKKPSQEIVDVIGRVGENPSPGGSDSFWGNSGLTTRDHTLTRKCSINYGDAYGDDLFDPAVGWDGHPIDEFSYLGVHTTCFSLCGNGVVEDEEICDGNSQSCVSGEYAGAQACSPACDGWENCQATESCGDGIVNGPEQCDDGNTINGDGCSDICQTEPGSISGFKYFDQDGDNQWDGWLRGEFKMNGWKIFIDGNGNGKYDDGERSDITSGKRSGLPLGQYSFNGIFLGTYSVCEANPFNFLPNRLGCRSNCQSVVVGAGEHKSGVNFGSRVFLFCAPGGT